MSLLREVARELSRGSNDWETFSFWSFYFNCRHRFASMTPDETARYQVDRAHNIVQYAVRYAPFFARFYQDHDLEDVWNLPVFNKALLMSNLSDCNTLGLTRQELLDFCLHVEQTRDFSLRLHDLNVGMSSGTSGNKGVEMLTRREENYLRATLFARFPLPKTKINLAFILRVSAPAFQLNQFGHRLTYVSQLQTIDAMCMQLEQLAPNVVSAPASVLKLLAYEQERGRLLIAPLQVVSYGEVLYPQDREFIARTFKCPVYEIYKATEGAIAVSCRHGRLHINEDLVAIQLSPMEGATVAGDKTAYRLIITDLHKTSLPIVRYELNDLITLSTDACECGSTFRIIAQVHGRTDDIFWGQRVGRPEMQPIFPDYISRAIISVSDEIEEYQAIQNSPMEVVLHIQAGPSVQHESLATALVAVIEKVFQSFDCHLPVVTVNFEAALLHLHSAKRIRIHRTFEAPL